MMVTVFLRCCRWRAGCSGGKNTGGGLKHLHPLVRRLSNLSEDIQVFTFLPIIMVGEVIDKGSACRH